MKTFLSRVWIGKRGLKGFWQRITYRDLPNYCSHCMKIGHVLENCKKVSQQSFNDGVQGGHRVVDQ